MAGVELNGHYGDIPLSTCTYVRPETGFPELAFMVIEDLIVRVDARSTVSQRVEGRSVWINVGEQSQISTVEGIRLGDSEARVRAAYPDAEISGHKYILDGHNITITASDQPDRRLIFETDGRQVIYIRSGRLPEVEWVEGCA